MKSLFKIFAIVMVLISFTSCKKDTAPNYQFFPQMYEPVGYEAYGSYEIFPNEQSALIPAEGSIPRGYAPFDIENNQEGYELAKASLKNPLSKEEMDMDNAKELYDIYCAICHGNKGDGQGTLVKREKILGIPSYADVGRAINEGSTYHTIYYGKNAMGSYANQLNEKERWEVVAYVMKLKTELEK